MVVPDKWKGVNLIQEISTTFVRVNGCSFMHEIAWKACGIVGNIVSVGNIFKTYLIMVQREKMLY